jgi:hypothetical protein
MEVLVTTAAAAMTIALIYLAARRMLESNVLALVAAAVFVTTPLLWTLFRSAPASAFPLCGVVVVRGDSDRTRTREAALAGIALGIGLYATTAAAVMMPLYAFLTVAVFAYGRRMSLQQLSVFAAAFTVSAAPFLWMLLGPQDQLRRTVNALRLYDADRFNILQGGREMTSWIGLTARTETFYNYFSPAFLFLTGAVLLPPLLVLVPIGLYQLIDKSLPAARLVLAGFLTAPAAAALTAEQPIPRRILFLTPFAAIVSAYGMQKILSWVQQLTK